MRVIRASSRNLRMLATLDEMSRSPLNGNNYIVYGQNENLKSKNHAQRGAKRFEHEGAEFSIELSKF